MEFYFASSGSSACFRSQRQALPHRTEIGQDWARAGMVSQNLKKKKRCFKLKKKRNGCWVVESNKCALQVSQVEMRLGREFQVEAMAWIKAWRQDSIEKSCLTRRLRKREKLSWKCVVESPDCQDKVFMPSFKGTGEPKRHQKISHITNTIHHQVWLKIS